MLRRVLSAVLCFPETVDILGCKMLLGTWKRVVLIELDGPRE